MTMMIMMMHQHAWCHLSSNAFHTSTPPPRFTRWSSCTSLSLCPKSASEEGDIGDRLASFSAWMKHTSLFFHLVGDLDDFKMKLIHVQNPEFRELSSTQHFMRSFVFTFHPHNCFEKTIPLVLAIRSAWQWHKLFTSVGATKMVKCH